ncbi:MAG: hypothetical protein ACMG6S_15135, partial [Byssovorax sp.]
MRTRSASSSAGPSAGEAEALASGVLGELGELADGDGAASAGGARGEGATGEGCAALAAKGSGIGGAGAAI